MSDRLIPESELKRAIKEVLAEMIGYPKPGKERKYYPTSQAWRMLGYSSAKELYRAIDAGLFRLGKEFQDRRKPQGIYPKYYFNIEKCLQRLDQLPEKRK